MSISFTPLVRKILLEAAKGGIEVAGPALVDGAWPILNGALKPVLDVLDAKLGGDVTRSPSLAQQAIDAFDQDPRLQERLRSGLLEAMQPLLAGGQELGEDVQKLLLIAAGNQRALDQLVARLDDVASAVAALDHKVDAGVNLSPQAIQAITLVVQQQIATAVDARALGHEASGAAEPDGWASEHDVDAEFAALNGRAEDLLQGGDPRAALRELRAGQARLGALLGQTPTNLRLKVHLGYLFKTSAQASSAAGDQASATRDLARAERAFLLVRDDVPPDQKTLDEVASAINGLGNVYAARGDLPKAIEQYTLATTLAPGYAYAWRHLFAANLQLAQQGQEVDPTQLRHALDQVRRYGLGLPALDADYLAGLQAALDALPSP